MSDRPPGSPLDQYLATGSLASAPTLDFTPYTFPQAEKKLDINRIPGLIKNRVFIGGDYDLMPILRFIKSIVAREKLTPILPFDFGIPREDTAGESHRLLQACPRAIFEATINAGHLLEIGAIAFSPFISTFVIYMAKDSGKAIPHSSTGLLMTWAKPPPKGYVTLEELNSLVTTFLKTPV